MWWAHKDLSVVLYNGTELRSGHLYGVTRLLKSLTEKYPQADIVLCLDGLPTHGKSLNPDYKANRAPSSAAQAFKDLGVLLTCAMAFLRVTVAYHRDLEADEVISYMARFYQEHYARVVVYSADCDMLQLLSLGDNVFISKEFDKKTGELSLVTKEVYASDIHYLDKFLGCDPAVLPLYRAMVGDSSDNLAGFPRMRKRVAKELAEKYRTEEKLAAGCVSVMDPLFPATFRGFLPKFHLNYEIMRLPTKEEIWERGCTPHIVGECSDDAFWLYSLYRVRSVAPMETGELATWEVDDALKIRDAVNESWRLPDKG